MPQKREYSKDDLDRVRELGRNNASVTAVASAFALDELERVLFVCDITNPATDLYKAYRSGLDEADKDIVTSLQNQAVSGDVDAARLIYERNFQAEVDAAVVYVNASTRFTDGFEFGFGAEIGISTQKLHARGPMALPEMTSYKYLITGDGQVRG